MSRLAGLTSTVLAASLIAVPQAQAAPPAGSVGSATDLGPITWDSRILGRDGGYSVPIGNAAVWVFGDTLLTVPGADGKRWQDNTMAITGDMDASNGVTLTGPHGWEHSDSAGVPTEYLPFSPGETWINAANDPARCGQPGVGECGQQFAVWPGPPVADPARNRVLFFFDAIRRGGSISGFDGWSRGIVVWNRTTNTFTRPETGPVPGGAAWDRWAMFGAGSGDVAYGNAPVVVNGVLYSLGCVPAAFFSRDCSMAKVSLANVLNRSAWRFYTGNGQWSANPNAAVTVVRSELHQSIHYNRHLGRYVLVDGVNSAYYRTAPQPWGPWSDRAKLFDAVPPDRGFNYFNLTHPEYGNGRTIYVTYHRPKGSSGHQSEVRLVKVVFRA